MFIMHTYKLKTKMEREWSQGHFYFLANGMQKEKKKV